jgi:hypothetical protein
MQQVSGSEQSLQPVKTCVLKGLLELLLSPLSFGLVLCQSSAE